MSFTYKECVKCWGSMPDGAAICHSSEGDKLYSMKMCVQRDVKGHKKEVM